jgi:hypothetical protein
MSQFRKSLKVFESKDAVHYAGALFRESFAQDFPVPHAFRILETPIGPEDWRQYVAVYTWPDGAEECVGFCNWIKYKDVYLEGGLAVRKNFYRRLDKAEFAECSKLGGVAQIIMETAFSEQTDSVASFGYCGDLKALRVDLRAGYTQIDHPYLIVKWMQPLDDSTKRQWIDDVARIGPF